MLPKKLLYITPGVPVAGAEKFMLLLSDSLKNDIERQILVSLSDNNALQPEFDKSIVWRPFPFSRKIDFKALGQLRKLIREEKPDTIFCINFYAYFIYRMATVFSGEKSKCIVSYHTTIHVNRYEELLHKMYIGILRKHELLITVSSNQANYTSKHYNLPVGRVQTIHNGIDTTHWRLPNCVAERNIAREQLDIPETAKVIIQAAAFRPEKNHLGAIRALKIIHTKTTGRPYLMFVGDGPLRNNITDLVQELQLTEYVKFAGMQKDMRPFYWASDVFTLCSVSVETFSIAALEAMSSGLPAVLTDIGGASEMVGSGVAGYLCNTDDKDIADKWQLALSTPFSANDIHQFVETNFSAEKMVADYKKIL